MSDKKYYVPELAEFHVGFEYEEKDIEWEPKVCGVSYIYDSDMIGDLIREGVIRVKYLTKEDIEDEVFKYVDSIGYKSNTCIFAQGEKYMMEFYLDMHFAKIWNPNRRPEDQILFQGTIRNRSELRRIMKMVGIKKENNV